MKRLHQLFVIAAIGGMISFGAGAAHATHSWNGYHWARTSNPFTVKLGTNVSSQWTSFVNNSAPDWSVTSGSCNNSANPVRATIVAGASGGRKCSAVTLTQRKQRGDMVRVALVGYTNVGKSTLMNLLSKSDVFAENKLFATLDTTVRKIVYENVPFLLSDTVGFIRKLPHDLIESFKSTLDEVREADILIHVVDISHPQFEDQINVVNQTLTDIGAGDKIIILVFNKIDAYHFTPKEEDDLTPATKENVSLDELKRSWISKMEGTCIFISAAERINIEELRLKLTEKVKEIHFVRYPNA